MVSPSCSCLLLSVGMEEITRKCDGLSLSAKEGERVVLSKKLTKAEHVLVAKFLTKRALNVEAVAEFIGETIRLVIKSNDPIEMKGGTFMRVRVMVDVTRPLCRGRRISFDEEVEGWVAFQYEQLPNICFWCGMLLHDNKDCEVWLKSKGSLSVEHQQYGHWIRASQFSPARRQYIEVKGYKQKGS